MIYAAAKYQTVGSLAAIMLHAGAVRAMELDINAEVAELHHLLPGRTPPVPRTSYRGWRRSPERYLTPDDQDFFAVYLK